MQNINFRNIISKILFLENYSRIETFANFISRKYLSANIFRDTVFEEKFVIIIFSGTKIHRQDDSIYGF
jgi:hypothetical protein